MGRRACPSRQIRKASYTAGEGEKRILANKVVPYGRKQQNSFNYVAFVVSLPLEHANHSRGSFHYHSSNHLGGWLNQRTSNVSMVEACNVAKLTGVTPLES